jgi:branched-chain amino acid transport system permease protein
MSADLVRQRLAGRVAGAVGLVLLLLAPLVFAPYWNGQLSLMLVFALAILGLNLISGYTGQLSIAQGFFLGIGAYTSAYLTSMHGWPSLTTLPVAAAVSGAVGLAVGIPVLRLRGFYLMVITLAICFLLPPLVKKFPDVTGGVSGISVPPLHGFAGMSADVVTYYVCLAVVAVAFLVTRQLVGSAHGPAMIAVRENELVAQALGINAARLKLKVFVVAAAYAGVAGALYVFVVSYVSPDSFGLQIALAVFAGALVGGNATITGAALGAVFVQLVPQYASDINGSLSSVIYGAAVILCVMFFPGGLAGIFRQVQNAPRFQATVSSLAARRRINADPVLEASPVRESTE